tara:strand:+ start:452 stop:1051 length:600 start_codon:yes stop_codon:yes gene_type:complete
MASKRKFSSKSSEGSKKGCSIVLNLDGNVPLSTQEEDIEYTVKISKRRRIEEEKPSKGESSKIGISTLRQYEDDVLSKLFEDYDNEEPCKEFHSYIKREKIDDMKKFEEQGSTLCGRDCILLEPVCDWEDGPLWKILVDAGRNAVCKCKGSCQFSCKRFSCYRRYAKLFKLGPRQRLPLCVLVYVSMCFGKSQVGFREY